MQTVVKSIASGVLLIGIVGQAHAETSVNIGVTSNYMWRGVTQTNDAPAIQGGLDYSHPSGFYLGTWTSNADFADPAGSPASRSEYEVDLYGGYAGDAGPLGYDVGVFYYAYPLSDDINFVELGASASYEILTAGLYYTLDGEADEPSAFTEGDIYYYAGAGFELPRDFALGLTVGNYVFDNLAPGADDEYVHYNATVSKGLGDLGEIAFALDVNDMDGEFPSGKQADDPRVSVMWSKAF